MQHQVCITSWECGSITETLYLKVVLTWFYMQRTMAVTLVRSILSSLVLAKEEQECDGVQTLNDHIVEPFHNLLAQGEQIHDQPASETSILIPGLECKELDASSKGINWAIKY